MIIIKKIYLLLNTPKVMLLAWLAFLFSPLLGIIRLRFLVNPDLNVLHINGLSTALFYAPFFISFFVLSIIVLWFWEFSKGRLTELHQKVFGLLSIMTIIFLAAAQYLINREFNSYPNYLYGHYGITLFQLQLMSFVAALQLMIFLAFYVYRSYYNPTKRLLKQNFSNRNPRTYLFDNLSLLVAILGILSLLVLSGATFFSWPILQRESKEGYEGKVGVDYKYIKLLSENTPLNMVVIHPPQGNKWPAIGNQPVLRYFLFPRTLVSGALVTTQQYAKQINEAYFVVIDPGGDREWPIINFSNKTITFNEIDSIKYTSLALFFKSDVSKIYKIKFQ